MAFGPQVRKDFFLHTPRLKWVHSLGTGTDGITNSPYLGKDVIVTATRGIHGAPISELAFLHDARVRPRLPPDRAPARRARDGSAIPARCWRARPAAFSASARSPKGLAPRCKAFGMRVVGISRTKRPVPGFDAMFSRAEMAQAAAELDYFVLLLPLEDDSRNIVDARVLAAMKPTAFLINLARGGVLDEDALIAALNEKRLAGAHLDALATEPLPPDNPLWSMPNVIITPHIGGYYDNYPRDAAMQFEQSLAHFQAGKPELMLHRCDL